MHVATDQDLIPYDLGSEYHDVEGKRLEKTAPLSTCTILLTPSPSLLSESVSGSPSLDSVDSLIARQQDSYLHLRGFFVSPETMYHLPVNLTLMQN